MEFSEAFVTVCSLSLSLVARSHGCGWCRFAGQWQQVERNGWMGKNSLNFKFQRKVSLGIAFESADLFGDHVPSCSVSSKDLGEAHCTISRRRRLMCSKSSE